MQPYKILTASLYKIIVLICTTASACELHCLHGEVGYVGSSGDLELEDALRGSGVSVEQGAGHGRKGVSRDYGGFY